MFTNGWMFWCIVSVFACLPPMTTMCRTLRGEHNALVCGYDKSWQCVWEKLSYCAGISRTVRCVNAKAKKKGRQRTAEKQTNRLAANYWWQIFILSFIRLAFFLFLPSCFLYFIVLRFKTRCKVPNSLPFDQNITPCEVWHGC